MWGGARGRTSLGARRTHPQDLVLPSLCLDEEMSRLACRDALTGLKGLERLEGDGDLGARLPRPRTRLVYHDLLDNLLLLHSRPDCLLLLSWLARLTWPCTWTSYNDLLT